MKTIKIKNISPIIYRDDIDKNKLYLVGKYRKKVIFIHFTKKELLNYFEERENIFNNILWFLEYQVFGKQGMKLEGRLAEVDIFIKRFKKNYQENELGLPELI